MRKMKGRHWIGTFVFTVGLSALVVVSLMSQAQVPTRWSKGEAERQYDSATIAPADGGAWGEVIQTLEDSGCELHRVRYRGIYYIANTCGGLVIEPN